MTFHIDISIDLRKAGNVTHHRQLVERNAEKNNAIDYYGNYEMWGRGRTVTRNHYVMSYTFPSIEKNILRFIQFVKEETSWQIEMVGFEQGKYELLFASRKYLTIMEGEMVRKYIRQKKHIKNGKYKNIIAQLKK
jgi:hypothetical protein